MQRALPVLAAALALLQFPVSAFSRITGIGNPVEAISLRGGVTPPEVPAGYTFSIWLVIFALASIYAVGLLRKNDAPAARTILPLMTGVFFCSSLWMMLAQMYGDGWYLVTVIVVMWALAVKAFMHITHVTPTLTVFERRFALPTAALYAGWLTAAMFLNMATTFAAYAGTLGLPPSIYAMLTLLPACAVGAVVLWRAKGQRIYLCALIWALAGIIVGNLTRDSGSDTVIGASTAGILILALIADRAGRRA